jgi:hypothetical protein
MLNIAITFPEKTRKHGPDEILGVRSAPDQVVREHAGTVAGDPSFSV